MTLALRTDPGASERILEGLRDWVETESPTDDAAAVNCLMDKAERALRAAGAAVTRIPGRDGFGDLLRARAAHSGGAFEEGRSAVVELAHQILAIHRMVDPARGITTNVAPIRGGTRPNVIADRAFCEIDLRVASLEDGERMERAILGLRAVTEGCTVTVQGGMNRPPFAETEAIRALYERARAIAAELGFELPREHRGGGSDGNFTAALGIPTLDGLGCPGGGAHADHEHILWRDLAPRAALLLGLIETLS